MIIYKAVNDKQHMTLIDCYSSSFLPYLSLVLCLDLGCCRYQISFIWKTMGMLEEGECDELLIT